MLVYQRVSQWISQWIMASFCCKARKRICMAVLAAAQWSRRPVVFSGQSIIRKRDLSPSFETVSDAPDSDNPSRQESPEETGNSSNFNGPSWDPWISLVYGVGMGGGKIPGQSSLFFLVLFRCVCRCLCSWRVFAGRRSLREDMDSAAGWCQPKKETEAPMQS